MRIRPIALSAMLAVLAGVAMAPVSVSFAQPPSASAPTPHGFDVEARLAELRTRIGLDANQTTQVRAILTDAKNQMEALRASAQTAPRAPGAFDDFRDRRRAILFGAEDRIWAILSCPQKDAFRLYVREQMEERLDHRGHGGRHGGHGGHGAHGHGHGHGRRP